MPYNKVEFHGYQIHTGPARPGNGQPDYYVGLPDDSADIAKRVALMKDAIDKAYPKASTDTNTLKVFMAPEFYFRGENGAYPIKYLAGDGPDLDPSSLMGGLAAIAGDAKYADWLFVFGTGLFHSVDAQNRYEAYNVAIAQKGSFTSEAERLTKCVVCMKAFKSGIDFLNIPAQGISDHDVTHLMPIGDPNYDAEINTPGAPGKDGYSGGSIFNLDGITFGIEVCLDHARRRLQRAWPGNGQYMVQLQLIPSGGITIDPAAIATCSDGLVFNVDGLNTRTLTDLNCELGYHTDLATNTVPWPTRYEVTPIAAVSPILTLANDDLDQVKQVFWLPPDNQLPTDWMPSIVRYPVQDIPAAVRMQV